MKSLRTLMTALLLSASVAMPAMMAADEDNAKGMHFKDSLSVQYFLEVARDRKASRVNNKFAFKSGDEIRFHLKSNIDGYAYIVLRSKNDPPQILFPTARMSQDTESAENRVYHDKWITLPGSGSLQFDNEPGTEKLALIISRDPVDPQSVLAKPSSNSDGSEVARIAMAGANKGIGQKFADVPIVAMNSSDSKDLVPSRVYIAYTDAPTTTAHPAAKAPTQKAKPAEVTTTAATKATTTTVTKVTTGAGAKAQGEKSTPRSAEKQTVNTNPTKGRPFFGKKEKQVVVASSHLSPAVSSAFVPATTANDGLPTNWRPMTDMGFVTIESSDPSGILAAEIALKHEK